MSQIPTAPPSGFRDFSPEDCVLRAQAIEAISKTYRLHGFSPIATSAVEDLAVLLGKGGGENEKLIFKIMKRGEQLEKAITETPGILADLGLRFDLTLPLARFYSKNKGVLPNPFKAFAMGPVWRAERAQKGRYREFWQCDVDIIGSDSVTAEIEIITAILAAFKASGLKTLPVAHVNDRENLLKRLELAGATPQTIGAACVIVDKLDKIEPAKVAEELKAISVDPKVLSAAPAVPERVKAILDAVPGAVFAPNLVRGFDYYTSTVFEFKIEGVSGSVGGGGRYDRLTEKFGGAPVPACGASIGFERLLLLLDAPQTAGPRVVVTVFSDELRGVSLKAASALRAAGISTDVYPGSSKLGTQFKYADSRKAAFAVVIGPDEAKAGQAKLKNLANGEEKAVSLADLPKLV
jgi:histidyl-tRNA synthetase